MSALNMARRISAGGELAPVDEYDADVEFEGWELEDGTDTDGWGVIVRDRYHRVAVHVRYSRDGDGDAVTTRIFPFGHDK